MAVDTAETATESAHAYFDQPGKHAPSEPKGASVGSFRAAAAISAVLVGIFLVWTALYPAVTRSTTDLDDVVKLVAATLAAISCFVFGRRVRGQTRLAWMWIGAFATSWAVGQA